MCCIWAGLVEKVPVPEGAEPGLSSGVGGVERPVMADHPQLFSVLILKPLVSCTTGIKLISTKSFQVLNC